MTNNARYIIWIGGIVLIVLIVLGLIAVVKAGNGSRVGDGNLTVPVSASDWTKGSATSTVTLVEYSDFQCPACAAYFPLVEQLINEKGSDFRFVYRHFPLVTIHLNAELASMAAEAAGRQGKFWEMYNKLFTNQADWEKSADAGTIFTQYATDLGLNLEKFGTDIKDAALKSKISADYKSGRDSGVVGTPTFFLNGKVIPNPRSIDEFKALIEAAKTGVTASSTVSTSTNATN